MTTSELIKELQRCDPEGNSTVMIRAACGSEGTPVDVDVRHEGWVRITSD